MQRYESNAVRAPKLTRPTGKFGEKKRCGLLKKSEATRSALHVLEKLLVRLGILEFIQKEFDRCQLVHGVQQFA